MNLLHVDVRDEDLTAKIRELRALGHIIVNCAPCPGPGPVSLWRVFYRVVEVFQWVG